MQTNRDGYVLTGPDLLKQGRRPDGWPLDRDPLTLETSVPGLFAAGDVRSGSTKRVAAAVGEGSMAVALVHRRLEELAIAAADRRLAETERETPSRRSGVESLQRTSPKGTVGIRHQLRSSAQIRIHPRTSAYIRSRNRRLSVPESAPLRNQEVGGSSPPSSISESPAWRGFLK